MKLKLFVLFLICSYFSSIHCSKQLFSLIENQSKQKNLIKGSIFGSYLEKVQKKIKKGQKLDKSPKNTEENKTRNKSKKRTENNYKINIKSHENRLKKLIIAKNHINRTRKIKKVNSQNKKHDREEGKKMGPNFSQEIALLQKKMKKYIKINKELIKEIKNKKKKSYSNKSNYGDMDDDENDNEDDDYLDNSILI